MAKKYEYQIVSEASPSNLERWLNQYGAEGWDCFLVTVESFQNDTTKSKKTKSYTAFLKKRYKGRKRRY